MISTPKRGLRAALGVCLSLLTTAITLLLVTGGGKPVFVTTHGTSMQPRFHTGDLAVLLPANSYQVGDIVAYRSNVLHTTVMHRIVKIHDGRYTFKGDNNSWLDPQPATRGELLGKLALRIPHGGVILHKARAIAPLAIPVILIAGAALGTRRRRRRHRTGHRTGHRAGGRHSKHAAGATAHPSAGSSAASSWRMSPHLTTAAAITAAAAVFGVFLGFMGLTAPSATAAEPRETPAPTVASKTTFSYSAAVGRTAAYDETTARAPAPIFRKVTNLVDLTAAYSGSPGTFTLTAELSTQAGWRSTITLCPATAFTGSAISRTVQLDLNALDGRAQAAAAATGIPSNAMGIDVAATVTPTGGDPFTSVLHLTMTKLELSMIGPASGLVHQSDATSAQTPTMPADRGGSAVSLFGRHLAAGAAIDISGVLLLVCALSATAVAARVRWIGRRSENEVIRRRYAALLVPTEAITPPAGRPVVDVPDMPTLAKIAERYELLVLHWSSGGVETFVVQDESATYRYRPTPPAPVTQPGRVRRILIEAGSA